MSIAGTIKRRISALASRATDLVMGSGLSQELLTIEEGKPKEGMVFESEKLRGLVRRAAAESCVLLKNDGVLPLQKTDPVAVLGRCQYDWFFVGYGSGGNVNAPYCVNLIDGFKNAGANLFMPLAREYEKLCSSKKHKADKGFWGHWPYSHPEFTDKLSSLDSAKRSLSADPRAACVVVIGRASGEDRDIIPEKGSWYLTDAERSMLDTAVKSFRRVIVVLNVGSLPDLSWINEYGEGIGAVLVAWLGGQESGNAVCDVLYGITSPCGRLPDTSAAALIDHPSYLNFGAKKATYYSEDVFVGYRHFEKFAKDKVLFPFGHGLSYSDFAVSPMGTIRTRSGVIASVNVKNVGTRPGKHSVLLRVFPPVGRIEKPVSVLAAFKKTRELAPGEEQVLTLVCDSKSLASFDADEHAFILEAGEYVFEADRVHVGGFTLNADEIVERVNSLSPSREELMARIEAAIPEEPVAPHIVDRSFKDAASGCLPIAHFVADLSKPELEALTRGHGMINSPLGAEGNAGVFGGITKPLEERGVPVLTCCDGPAGIRMKRFCTLLPCGTALAATFDTVLVRDLYEHVAHEMEYFGVDVLLAPGMNIHRSPLCGRNFEYYSEDPLLTGTIAAACVRGLAAGGKAACPKHFACNNQEAWRNLNDSVVSERALREIYLRGFEICVKQGRPDLIMTSYNKVNGVYSHYNFDLATTVLRNEWGFDGAVMTDWWMRSGRSPEYPKLRDNAYRVRAQVDVLMPGNKGHLTKKYRSDGSLLASLGAEGGITKAELQRSAANVLKVLIKLKPSGARQSETPTK